MDVDCFKQFNDTYGPVEGDKILSTLGQVVEESIRNNDIPCRYGGEEFVVIVLGVNAKGSANIAERIRNTFMIKSFNPTPDLDLSFTINLGVAQMRYAVIKISTTGIGEERH